MFVCLLVIVLLLEGLFSLAVSVVETVHSYMCSCPNPWGGTHPGLKCFVVQTLGEECTLVRNVLLSRPLGRNAPWSEMFYCPDPGGEMYPGKCFVVQTLGEKCTLGNVLLSRPWGRNAPWEMFFLVLILLVT